MPDILYKIFTIPAKSKSLAFKILIYSHIYFILAIILPFKRMAKKMGKQCFEADNTLETEMIRYCVFLKKVLIGINKYWPYKFRCLIQALVISAILREKRIPHTTYLGVKKETRKMKAHAWLKCGNLFISGNGPGDFNTVSFFGYIP